MKITLEKLTMINFKGVIEKVIEFFGDADVFGANESGKSTLLTAVTWVLTGKDEFDRKDYEIKNTIRKELNSRPHEVEVLFDVDGVKHKLKRVYLEKWVKQKGQSQKTFEGHKTEFWYNDVPCNLSEYQAKVDALIDPKIIKLVTNPTYFNSLKWEDQRRGLIGIAGNITDNDVFDAIATPQNDYCALINILNSGKSIEDYKKELGAKKSLLKKEATEYAPRIDEAKRSIPDPQDWQELEQQIADKNQLIHSIDDQLSDASIALAAKQKGILGKQKDLYAKQTEVTNIRFKTKSDLQQKQNSGASAIQNIHIEIKGINDNITRLQKLERDNTSNKTVYQNQISDKQSEVNRLRSEWDLINAEKFDFKEDSCQCPTCLQMLPPDEIESKRDQLKKNFNDSVARRKAEKVASSNQVKAEIKQLEDNITAIDQYSSASEIQTEQGKLTALNIKLAALQQDHVKKQVDDVDTAVEVLLKVNGAYLNLVDDIKILEAEIKAETETIGQDNTQAQKESKQRLQVELDDLKKKLAIKEAIAKTEIRIKQLETEESQNGQAIADIEKQEFEIETYIRAKMDILEKKVNRMFRYVKFRLFEVQVNGAIAETCVCEYNGVPYPTLNTAAKLLAGMDVLETLSNFYNVHAPVFCDNRESVTYIPESESQVISLYVSPADRKLRIESATTHMSQVA